MAALVLRPTVHCRHLPEPSSSLKAIPAVYLRIKTTSRGKLCGKIPTPTVITAVSTGVVGDASGNQCSYETNEEIKAALYQAVKGINRGIFGATSAKKSEILELLELLEARNPTPQPTDNLLDKVDGTWKLVYSTISILGAKRTKLGLRDFVTLGDFFQTIDVAKEKAFNVIKFNVRGLKMLNGQLTIEASYKITSKTRVDIKLENSTITPDQLMNLFKKNYDVLLAIFNPEGWLDITYADDYLRIGRDNKGNIFVLERTGEQVLY